MSRDNATIVRRFVDEVITQGNIEAAAQYVWEDVIEQVPLPFPISSSPSRNRSRNTIKSPAASNGPVLTGVSFSVFPRPDALFASGELSSTVWKMAVSRTPASSWIPSVCWANSASSLLRQPPEA
jgi:hypothetical protein